MEDGAPPPAPGKCNEPDGGKQARQPLVQRTNITESCVPPRTVIPKEEIRTSRVNDGIVTEIVGWWGGATLLILDKKKDKAKET